MKMFKTIAKVLGGLLAVTMLATPIFAAAVTINVTGITNHLGASLSGAYVQIIQSADGTRGAPGANGLPAGDTVVGTGTTNASGAFTGAASIPSSNYVYIRVWETWNGTGNPTTGTYYGDGAIENVGTGFVYTYDPAGFSTNATLTPPSAGTLQFSAATYTVSEAGPTVTITVTRTGGSAGAVGVSYATSNGTATSGSDYTAASGTLSWADGDAVSKTFTVAITDDAAIESAETVNLTLSGPSGGATLGAQNTATLTINDNDNPVSAGALQFSAATYTVGEVGPTATITVTRTGGSTGAVGISYATSNGTATSGSDYTAASGTLSWTNGDAASKTFTIPITEDTADESDETVTITLSAATGGATLGSPSTATLTITDNDGGGGNTVTVSRASAYVGQTIVLTGAGFGATKGTSTVTVGGIAGNPTAWSDTSITLAVPSGATSGDVVVTAGGQTATGSFTLISGGAFLDDVEGGSVGTWATGLADSGYFTYGTGITPDNSTISTDGPQASALHGGARGMRVRYSYTSDWGGGWGATLANIIDASAYDRVTVFIDWDGSTNDIKLSLKDADGTAFSSTIANATLSALGGYGQITIMQIAFAYDADGSTAGANQTMDWAQISSYNFVYTTQGTSANYQSIDSLAVGTVDDGGGVTPPATGEVIVTSLVPPAGPAGTKFTALGSGFGDNQGQSVLIFENLQSHTTYQCEILSWSATSIEAIVPRLAPAGNYTAKVVKIAVAQGTIQAFESNPSAFQVTAGSGPGGTATIYPNPFNPLATSLVAGIDVTKVTLAYNATGVNAVGIYIYDSTAQLVYHAVATGGQVTWDGRDSRGNHVADGLYLLRVVNEDNKTLISKGKILVIKK